MAGQKLTDAKLELAYKIESNFINSFRINDIPGAVFWEDDIATGFITGHADVYLNCVFRFTSKSIDITNEIQQTVNRFKERQCPASWFVGTHTLNPEEVTKQLDIMGVKHASAPYRAMVLDKSKFHCSQPIPELRIEPVDDKTKLSHFLKPFQIGFEMDDQATRHFELYFQSRMNKPERENWFVGYLNELPVSVSGYFIDSGVIMIHSVVTLPEYRRQGYGRKMNEASISAALKIADLPVTLYGSKMGESLYRSIGFSDVYMMAKYLLENTK